MPRVFEPIVLVHGGAGDIPDSRDNGKLKGTKLAARIGYSILQKGGTSIDAVEEAVKSMELDDMFNAGKTQENLKFTFFKRILNLHFFSPKRIRISFKL